MAAIDDALALVPAVKEALSNAALTDATSGPSKMTILLIAALLLVVTELQDAP